MNKINIMALRHSAFYSPLLITIAGGFLKKQGLEACYEPATPEKTVPDSLRNGSAHLAQSAVATSFSELEKGKQCDIVHFAKINERDGFFLASRNANDSFQWQELIGKEVLVDHFFQPMAMFRYALHKQGIDEQEITIIDAGSVEQIDLAFRNGQADFVHQQGPFPQQLEQDGVGYVVASIGDAVGPVAFSSLCARREWLKTDAAKVFMQAYREACQYVLDTSASELAQQLKGYFPKIDLQVLTNTIGTYQKLGCWTPDPAITKESYENLLEIFSYNNIISRKHEMGSCVVDPPE
ncbi:MAG: ABC transporter substrate-binding protein [Gammaproteobacteria bacterium]|jgi:NitT/TauT family transport system substrate-binding protein